MSAREGKRIRKTFDTSAAARAWRHDAAVAVREGTPRAPTATTLQEAASAWLDRARDESIRNHSSDLYKPDTRPRSKISAPSGLASLRAHRRQRFSFLWQDAHRGAGSDAPDSASQEPSNP
jgi:hypothetical protein